MEFQARFPAVTARAATFEDDGDKIMVLFRDGVPVEILASSVFDAVYAPVEPAAPPAKVKTIPPKAKAAPRVEKPATARSAPGTHSVEILALVRKKPMSSGELIDAMKVAPSIVYSTVNVMKGRGDIENKVSDEDGVRRWFPKGLM